MIYQWIPPYLLGQKVLLEIDMITWIVLTARKFEEKVVCVSSYSLQEWNGHGAAGKRTRSILDPGGEMHLSLSNGVCLQRSHPVSRKGRNLKWLILSHTPWCLLLTLFFLPPEIHDELWSVDRHHWDVYGLSGGHWRGNFHLQPGGRQGKGCNQSGAHWRR